MPIGIINHLYKLCRFAKGEVDFFVSFDLEYFLEFFAIAFSDAIKSFSAFALATT